jgi:hypothetical protein
MAATVIKTLPGNKGGRVFDYRGTGAITPNGGKIHLLAMVEHIPVVPNLPGTADFELLARVIREQGLGLQAATDREGNVAIYTDLNRLCWQARGLNSSSCGVEHMHMTTSEPWVRVQFNASAWLWHYAKVVYGLEKRRGVLAPAGPGLARVVRKGHVTHQEVSAKAGYNDRTDPGPGYDFEYVQHAANYFGRHHTFAGV